MRFVLTALAMIGGIVFTLVGLGFLFEPESTGAGFGLVPNGAPGLAVLRADMTAFFVVGGVCMIWGAWRRSGRSIALHQLTGSGSPPIARDYARARAALASSERSAIGRKA